MRQKTGFQRPYLVTSAPDDAGKTKRDKVARRVIGRIEECRADLIGCGEAEAAKILDIALLQLSLSLNNVNHDELKSITEALHTSAKQPPADREDRA